MTFRKAEAATGVSSPDSATTQAGWADTTVWESDFIETIDGVTQTKGRNNDTWENTSSLNWAKNTYSNCFNAGGSSSTLTLSFGTPLSIPANSVLHIYWGATKNRTLSLKINGSDASFSAGNVVDNTDAHPQSEILDATYTFTSATTLNSFYIKTNGSNTYFFHVAIVAPGSDTTPPTLSSSNPANNATDVATSGNITLTFSENVTIKNASNFSLSDGILGTPTVSGSTVTIPYSGLSNGTQYTLRTAAGAVQDAANNASAALRPRLPPPTPSPTMVMEVTAVLFRRTLTVLTLPVLPSPY